VFTGGLVQGVPSWSAPYDRRRHSQGTSSYLPGSPSGVMEPGQLEVGQLTILTGWAEGVAEALAYTPTRARCLLTNAQAGAPWRTDFGLAEPSPRLNAAIQSMGRALASAAPAGGTPSFDALVNSARQDRTDERDLDRLVRRVLRSTLEQLRSRQATENDPRSYAP
jgi:hypothetical protein